MALVLIRTVPRVLATLPKTFSRHAPKIRWPNTGRRGGSQPPIGLSALDRVARVMEPGAWYAVSDLRHLAGLPETTQDHAIGELISAQAAGQQFEGRRRERAHVGKAVGAASF